eukprot:TRINITY_DN16450_c0_g2_i1.p1 TRINITY_DN16450_c0_g2~~TRINITY_DN16450_c0_g2_i1.p1  ORF type:complete len:906 (+),score=160.06 TRINITY_DN16450_c0_g2_i1:39-2720(+)
MQDPLYGAHHHVYIPHRSRIQCSSCGEQQVSDNDINIGNFMNVVTKGEMYLRVVGSRINGTVARDDMEVIEALAFVSKWLAIALDENAFDEIVFIDSEDSDFVEKVIPVLGCVELLLLADFCWDEESQGLYFKKPTQHHRWTTRRGAAVMRLIRDELNFLARGQRKHTAVLHGTDAIRIYIDEFSRLAAEYERPDSYPNFSDAICWMRLRDHFITAASATKDRELAAHYSHYSEQSTRYLEKVLSYNEYNNITEAFKGGSIMSACRFSEELQMQRYLKKERGSYSTGNNTPATGSLSPCETPLGSLSPEIVRSPGITLIRTPYPKDKKYAFERALPVSPRLLVREPTMQFAGLLNVVQNCFMNCLLQAYYMSRSFRQAIMNFPSDWIESPPEDDISTKVKLIHRLQAVFSYLEISSASCINPEYVLETVGKDNPSFQDGGQHDPHEFADAFIDMVANGFKSLGSPEVLEPLEKLVFGESLETSIDRNGNYGDKRTEKMLHFVPLYLPQPGDKVRGRPPLANGTPIPPCKSEVPIPPSENRHISSNLDKQIAQCSRQLLFKEDADACEETPATGLKLLTLAGNYPSLDIVLLALNAKKEVHVDPVDLPIEEAPQNISSDRVSLYDALDQLSIDFKDKLSSTAATLKSFTVLPNLLMFYLPARTAGVENRMLDFNVKIHLDRYINSEDSNAARDTNMRLLEKSKELENEIASKNDVVKHLIETMNSRLGFSNDEKNVFGSMIDANRAVVAKSQEELDQTNEAIVNCYDDIPCADENTYHLLAIIVHKAIAEDFGHYYSYAVDRRNGNRWIKFDDTKVIAVSSDEVFSEATRRNVYCMFYESEAAVREAHASDVNIPQSMREIIQYEDRRWKQKTQTRAEQQVAERHHQQQLASMP